ncbi:MAG: hypothetical protein AAF399_21390 [Bacteroidota bacterium]
MSQSHPSFLYACVAIGLAGIIAIVYPVVFSSSTGHPTDVMKSQLMHLRNLQELYHWEHGSYTTDLDMIGMGVDLREIAEFVVFEADCEQLLIQGTEIQDLDGNQQLDRRWIDENGELYRISPNNSEDSTDCP